MVASPTECLLKQAVFPGEGGVRHGPAVGIDTERHARPVKPVNRMIRQGWIDVCLNIGTRTHFQMNLFIDQTLLKQGVFHTAHPMT